MKKKTLVALGASLGGIAALYEFFDNTLPDEVSYVVTTHLYPHEKSHLAEMLQRRSALKVCEVSEETLIMADTVYVMPENKVMAINVETLTLKPRDLKIKMNMAIDIFFASLAQNDHFNVIAVILSGLGKDGTKGIASISKNGGVIIAQEVESAAEGSMPQGVITSGYANFIMRPREMPAQVIKSVASFN